MKKLENDIKRKKKYQWIKTNAEIRLVLCPMLLCIDLKVIFISHILPCFITAAFSFSIQDFIVYLWLSWNSESACLPSAGIKEENSAFLFFLNCSISIHWSHSMSFVLVCYTVVLPFITYHFWWATCIKVREHFILYSVSSPLLPLPGSWKSNSNH